MSGSAAGACPAIHERLVRRRAVARAVGRALASAVMRPLTAALDRLASLLEARPPV